MQVIISLQTKKQNAEILIGFAVLCASVPAFRSLARRQKAEQRAKMRHGDERLKLTHESLQGIKVINSS